MAEDLHVEQRGDSALELLALAHALPVLGDLEEQVEIDAAVVLAFLEGRDDHLDRRLAVPERQRHHGGVDDVRSCLGGFQVVHRGHAADVVAVHVDRKADLFLERTHHLLSAERRQHPRHVLDADRVCAEVLEHVRVLEVGVERVHRAHRVGDGALEVPAAFLDGLGRDLDVARVVQRIEHAEDVDTVALRRMHETAHDVVAVVPVADEVLPAKEHLQRRLGDVALDDAQPVPGILVEKPQRRVERGAAPDLERPVADRVHLGKDRQHVGHLHARRPQRLMGVTEGGVGYVERSHGTIPLSRAREPAGIRLPGWSEQYTGA